MSNIVDGSDEPAYYHPVREGYIPGARLQLSVDGKARNQAGVEGTDVGPSLPIFLGMITVAHHLNRTSTGIHLVILSPVTMSAIAIPLLRFPSLTNL